MNTTDYDKKHCNKDVYGNIRAKNQRGIENESLSNKHRKQKPKRHNQSS